ncbi:bromodomain-containing protein 8 isoform X2 [Etheostoma cragini]|uniref:bromodomain-containing protein 8 isoform X2 n=1 Tax=Etheostoma cragini TaxID=417921 RepID=UPI00155DF4CF|nr:bromodomain-containing protein 8 isoform X2 [Etheostoma cragini]XP_034738766.1 bromodomain-containing protein 8 isoform X2 [Etheostoma cragini]
MASGIGKHKILNVGPTEPWSVREKLCLASSVMRSGDQNWVSVSRAIKPFSEPGRPPDWFSQKHCASQYSELLEATEAPKRKRGEKGEVVETIEDVIVRRLTTERIEELKKLLRDTQEQYRKLKKEVDLIQTGHMDSQLKELWAEITLKKKQAEEEAEQKRRATETAYQARQAIKNTPKRLPSVTVRSPMGASPPTMDPQADSSVSTQSMDTGGVASDDTTTHSVAQGVGVFLPATDAPGPGPKDGGLAALVDDSPQKRLLTQKATPPPSPLLSELLKKGNLISASPRLVGEGDSTGSLTNGVQTATAATALPPGHDVITEGEAEAAVKVELGEETGLVEDLVSVSYMGDELDLETVGDIIAIIEEKVDDSVEALDAAAVEAALSLCEEAGSEGHTLPGPWETQELKASDPSPTLQDSDPTQEPRDMATMSALIPPGMDAQNQPEIKREQRLKGNCDGPEVTGSDVNSDDGAPGSEVTEEGAAGKEATEARVKSEGEEWNQTEPNPPCLDSEDSSVSGKESKEVKEEEAGSEGDPEEGMELKEECGEGEGPYLSEVERAASESEDGYGPPSQRYTADSLASSPASSSQLSTCGEDQEAVQAQKIWKKAIMLVWRAAANHRYASVFLQPVSDDIAPGYHSIVHRPMDLSAIKKNIESGVIRTTAEFQRDIMLMFQNAVMYNSSDHDVYHMALEMQRDVLEHVQQFLATQLIMQTSESAISAKSLRGREGNRKPGEPAEKDSVPMASPAFLLSLFDGGTRGRRSAMEADLKMKK